MLYHVIRRPSYNSNTSSFKPPPSNYETESREKLMPRYHYSKITPSSPTTSSESFFPRQHFNGQSSKPSMTTTSNHNNHNDQYPYGSFRSTFIPLVTNLRMMTPNKREFIQIPVTREDGTTTPNNPLRSVPITFVNETGSTASTTNSNGGITNLKPQYTSLLRPSSKYSQYHSTSSGDESPTAIPRLPSVSRRLSLTIPVMTTVTKADDDSIKQNLPSSSIRQIPIRLSQPSNAASIPTNSSRILSAILRSSSVGNPANHQLKRQKTDLTDASISDFTGAPLSPSPIRRAEVMAREAIQGVARFQQQQQQRNDATADNNNNPNAAIRSPALSRRVIVNLKNNQSVSLDSNCASANSSSTKPPLVPSSSRLPQRNNLYHIPVLHEIQVPSSSATMPVKTTLQAPLSPSASSNRNNNSFKNEFRMEIPVTIVTSNDQENSIQRNGGKENGILDDDQQPSIFLERLPSANGASNAALKSILKRSSSRETVSRKNVSFMNA